MERPAADLESWLPDLKRVPLAEITSQDSALAHSLRRVLDEADSLQDAVAGFQSAI